jgi:DNA polymerase
MDGRSPFTLAEEFAAAQEWWNEAGVDLAFEDATAHWLKDAAEEASAEVPAPAAAPKKAPPTPPRPKIGGEAENWPQALEAFAQWWLTEPSLDAGGSRPRIPPRGKQGAKLMILVPEPEAGDTEELLSGPLGKLLGSFLSAAGIAGDEAYFATILPRHTPHPDWTQLAETGLGAVTLHHVALAAPERVLAFGRDILPLIGHDPAQTAQSLPEINHHAGSVPLFAERSLDFLLARPAARSGFWQRWLDWTGS